MQAINFSKSLNFNSCAVNINYVLEPVFKITSVNLETLLRKKKTVFNDNYQPDKILDKIISSITAYFEENKPLQIKLEYMQIDSVAPFYRKVLETLFDKVPHGKVTTYQNLAALSGNPNASRAAGTAMSSNPFPLLIPCHRVLKSDLNVGNYGSGPELKLFLLKKEVGENSFENMFLVNQKALIICRNNRK